MVAVFVKKQTSSSLPRSPAHPAVLAAPLGRKHKHLAAPLGRPSCSSTRQGSISRNDVTQNQKQSQTSLLEHTPPHAPPRAADWHVLLNQAPAWSAARSLQESGLLNEPRTAHSFVWGIFLSRSLWWRDQNQTPPQMCFNPKSVKEIVSCSNAEAKSRTLSASLQLNTTEVFSYNFPHQTK